MNLAFNKRQYILYGFSFLLVAFAVALLQNYVRYSIHESYQIWTSVSYLAISLLLFSGFLPAVYSLSEAGLIRYRKNYILYVFIVTTSLIFIYYLISSVVIYLFGFYDSMFSLQYARQYFGREAVVHMVLITITGFIFFHRSTEKKEKQISAASGRKEITISTRHIQWIEADDHYLKIHTEKESLLKRGTLGSMENELKPDFIRIHRKYLVNKNQIMKKERNNRDEFVILRSGDKLKIGRSYSPLEW